MRRRRYSEADLRAMIPLYLDGALDAADRAQVEAYYLQHPEVLTQFGESSRMIELLDDAVIVQPADPAFTTDVLGEVARLRPLPRLWQQLPPCPPVTALRWATEIALLVTLLVLLWMHPWAPPINPLECHLLGDETWALGQPAGVRVVVRHEGRGRELPSATVRLSLHRERWRRTLLRARTNDQGTIDVDLQLDPDITAGNYLLVGEAEALGARATVSHRVRIMPRVTVAVTPLAAGFVVGDPLLVRVTATDGARRPVDQPLPWRLAANSGVLLARGVVTPRLGQALLQVETSSRLPAGRVALLVESPHGSVSVPLQLLPRLADELRIEAPDLPASVVGGQPFTVTAAVATPTGLPVAGARTRAVLSSASGRSELTGVTDGNGRWRCRLPAPPRPGWARLRLAATANSLLGGLERPLRIATAPLELTMTVPGTVVAGLDSPLLVHSHWLNGAAADRELLVSLNGSRTRRHQPRHGALELLVRPVAGRNELQVTVPGLAAADRRFRFYAAGHDGLVVRPARRHALAGEALRVEVLAARRTPEAYLDLAGTQTLATRSLHLKNGRRGEIVVYPPAGVGGRVLLRAYARHGGSWRLGWTTIWVDDPAPARVDLVADPSTPGGVAARAVAPDGAATPAELIVAAVSEGVAGGATPPREAPRQPFRLLANSANQARQEALDSQRRFFASSSLLGGAIGGLLLMVVILWLAQVFGDPFEYVAPHERRAWGRVPQVHRRGAWAGYGALLAGMLVAGGVTAGILLAGYQARELAATASEPLGNWYPRLRTAISQSAHLVEAGLAAATASPSPGAAPRLIEVAAREAAERPATYAPASPARQTWQIAAYATTRQGPLPPATASVVTPGRFAVSWQPPDRLTLTDVVSVPVTIENPSEQTITASLLLEVDGPLAVEGGRRRAIEVPAGTVQTVALRCRATGLGTAQLRLQCLAPAPTSLLHTVELTQGDWPFGSTLAGYADARTDQTITLSGSGRLHLEAWAEPLQPWDQALAALAARPATSLRELLGIADAALYRYQLWEQAGRLPPAKLAELRSQAAREAQAVLSHALPDGSFAARRGAAGSLLASAEGLILLRRLARAGLVGGESVTATWRFVSTGLQRLAHTGSSRGSDHLALQALCAYALAKPSSARDAGPALAPLVEEALASANSYSLAALGNAVGIAWSSDQARPLLRALVNQRSRRADGSNWFQPGRGTASGAAGRGAAVETTALAVLACSRSEDGRLRAVARDGARYLAESALADGTWGSAWLSALALRAILTAEQPPAAARGLLLVDLDGARVGRATLGAQSAWRHAVELPSGDHTVRLRFYGRGRPGYRLRASSGGPAPSGLTARLAAPARLAAWQPLELQIDCRNPTGTAIPEAAVELPLPAGFRLRQPGPAQTVSAGRLCVLTGPLPPQGSRQVSVVLHPTTPSARLAAAEGSLRALHNPNLGARLRLPAMVVGP